MDPEPCKCGDRDCPECYRQWPRPRYQDEEPEAADEFGRYTPNPED